MPGGRPAGYDRGERRPALVGSWESVFSSAITAYLSLGNSILKSVEKAEHFFNDRFLNFIELPQQGKVIDLTLDREQIKVINQIKEIYHFISSESKFSTIPRN